jgi:hypothetical protein
MNSVQAKLNGIPFPEVPNAATFVNLGLNKYPVRNYLPQHAGDNSLRCLDFSAC